MVDGARRKMGGNHGCIIKALKSGFLARHARGEIELYFFDASGFSLTPCVP